MDQRDISELERMGRISTIPLFLSFPAFATSDGTLSNKPPFLTRIQMTPTPPHTNALPNTTITIAPTPNPAVLAVPPPSSAAVVGADVGARVVGVMVTARLLASSASYVSEPVSLESC